MNKRILIFVKINNIAIPVMLDMKPFYNNLPNSIWDYERSLETLINISISLSIKRSCITRLNVLLDDEIQL